MTAGTPTPVSLICVKYALAPATSAADDYLCPRRLHSSSSGSSDRQTSFNTPTLPLSAIVTLMPIASESFFSSKSTSASFAAEADREIEGLSAAGVCASASACHTDSPSSTMRRGTSVGLSAVTRVRA